MVITCIQSVPITYVGKDGNKKTVFTRPGSRDYPEINHKDPMVAEQLRVYRKHSKIGFNELLATDLEILEGMKDVKAEDKPKELLKAVTIKPSPVGKVNKGKKKKKNGSNPKPVKAASPKSGSAEPKKDPGKGAGKVS
jgi:hypothetical protein